MSKIFYIDLFSGAGGTTTGIHMAGGDVTVLACVNHDTNAIESHKANHPECVHFIEDVRDWNVVVALKKMVDQVRREYPDCIIALWASLECTNYSRAKGGLPRDADSRTLAHALYMYLDELKPDYVDIENVREFMSWGPLDENGRPISRLNGVDYSAWVAEMQSRGYDYDWRLLNAADYGAYTSRERYFGQFAKTGLPIVWPEPTHDKKAKGLKPWKPVKDILDLDDDGQSIFNRKKPLCENTLKRIYAGLVKFVAGGDDVFIQKYFSGHPESKVFSINQPAHTITAIDHHSIISANRGALNRTCFLAHYYGNGFSTSVESPCPTLRTKDSAYLVRSNFITNYYSGGGQLASIDNPSGTITGVPKQRLTSVLFIDQQFGQSKPHSVNRPAGAVTATPKLNLVSVKPWLMNTNFSNIGSSLDSPAPVITANRKYHYILNPRINKAPVSVLPVLDNESEVMKKIKAFMTAYGVIDIKMRMLKIPELLKIQGFPDDYKLKGTKTQQKKYIGNAVVPTMAKAIIQTKAAALQEGFKQAI